MSTEEIQVFIDDVKINEIFNDGTPIPDIISRKARLSYLIVKGDEGQLIVDKAIYGEDGVYKYTVKLPHITYEYEGEVCSYELIQDGILRLEIELHLCGKFTYSRDDVLIIERDFTRPKKT